jgi:hypothetical protein
MGFSAVDLFVGFQIWVVGERENGLRRLKPFLKISSLRSVQTLPSAKFAKGLRIPKTLKSIDK